MTYTFHSVTKLEGCKGENEYAVDDSTRHPTFPRLTDAPRLPPSAHTVSSAPHFLVLPQMTLPALPSFLSPSRPLQTSPHFAFPSVPLFLCLTLHCQTVHKFSRIAMPAYSRGFRRFLNLPRPPHLTFPFPLSLPQFCSTFT